MKKAPLRITAAVLAVLALIFLILGINAYNTGKGDGPAAARDGIVWVYTEVYDIANDEYYAWSGTGWAIGTPGEPVQYFVTNGHVVEPAVTYPEEYPGEYSGEVDIFFSAETGDYVPAEVVFYSPAEEKDMCILKIPTPTTKRTALTLRPSDDVEVGESVYALGYPGLSSDLAAYSTFDTSDITVTRGVISKRTMVSDTQYESFQMDTYINSGNSGGPLVDENGFVVGINTLGSIDTATGISTGMNYAIIADELMKVLSSLRLTYTVCGLEVWKSKIDFPLAGVFFLAALICFALTLRNSGANADPNKNRKPVLRVQGGTYAGRAYLMEGTFAIGRNAAGCRLIFPDGTPGISFNHCSVRYDPAAGGFVLTDNGSSFGTFLGDGTRLNPGQPALLRPGDSFYLADGANRFTVGLE